MTIPMLAPSRSPRRSARRSAAFVALACTASTLFSGVALAQGAADPNCPPGSWFCADTPQKPAAAPNQPVSPQPVAPSSSASGNALQPLPQQQPVAPAAPVSPLPPPVVYQPAPVAPLAPPAPPPVIIYQPAPRIVLREAPPPYHYVPREAAARRREWGLNLRLEGAMMGSKASDSAGMGGVGVGLRYKPVPAFGIEAGLDFVGGRDYDGFRRQETAFTLNGMVFVNPRSRTQVYFLAGFGWAGARVSDDNSYGDVQYNYFGGQAGVGLEFRLARHFALNLDVRGFVRGRTDDNAKYTAEFRDPETGRTTNTSGGGLFTGGMTFYF